MGRKMGDFFLIVRREFELSKKSNISSAVDFIIRRQENMPCQNKEKITNMIGKELVIYTDQQEK